MPEDSDHPIEIINQGEFVLLRKRIASDQDHYERWLTEGEWRQYDAPWQWTASEEKTDQDQKAKTKIPEGEVGVEKMAVITTLEDTPLGWVNRYRKKLRTDAWFVGINICKDNFLNQGYGSEALRLWVDYLFANSEIHKIGLDTWSFNPRMVRVAEKIGFTYEGRQRAMQFWQGQWLDALHFGILRGEWNRTHEGDSH